MQAAPDLFQTSVDYAGAGEPGLFHRASIQVVLGLSEVSCGWKECKLGARGTCTPACSTALGYASIGVVGRTVVIGSEICVSCGTCGRSGLEA